MTVDEAPVALGALVLEHLFGAQESLDPAETAMQRLAHACTQDIDVWERVAVRVAADHEVGPQTKRALAAIGKMCSALERCRDRGTAPGLAAWADVVEEIAFALSDEDLERSQQRHARLTQALRAVAHTSTQAKAVAVHQGASTDDEWGWTALTTCS